MTVQLRVFTAAAAALTALATLLAVCGVLMTYMDNSFVSNLHKLITTNKDQIVLILKNGSRTSVHNVEFVISQSNIIRFINTDSTFMTEKMEEFVGALSFNSEISWCFNHMKSTNTDTSTLTRLSCCDQTRSQVKPLQFLSRQSSCALDVCF